MRTRHSNGLLIVAILLISTAPLYAQRHQQNVAKLKADARNVVGTIANDKAKTQTYCQILYFARQLVRADHRDASLLEEPKNGGAMRKSAAVTVFTLAIFLSACDPSQQR